MWYSSDLTTRLPNKLSGRTDITARWGYAMHKVEAFGYQAFVGGASASSLCGLAIA